MEPWKTTAVAHHRGRVVFQVSPSFDPHKPYEVLGMFDRAQLAVLVIVDPVPSTTVINRDRSRIRIKVLTIIAGCGDCLPTS